MLIDTHAHVNFSGFKEDAVQVIQRALEAGVEVINVGTQIDTSKQAVEMANRFEKGVYAVIGLHPVHTYSQELDEEETHFKTREEHFDTALYRSLAQDPKVVGIGECGLDYFRLKNEDIGLKIEQVKQTQKEAFLEQIKLAKELDKTLVIHSRSSKGTDDACLDILEILKKDLALSPTPSTLRFVLHSYTGSPEVAAKFVEIGAYISFNGIITFDKTGNQEAVLKVVPNDKIVLETDCPYLTPVPMRGKRNEPLFVKHVAEKVAQVKGVSVQEIEEMTSINAKRLFKLS
jgi:TatD DNase family protein